jgi:hypothetical protein
MKGRTLALDLMHVQAGHHREFNFWHDYDHQPEVIGTVPDVFIAQFWVAPPSYVAARPRTSLEFDGGEYLNMYWSQGSPEALVSNFYLKGKELRPEGRMVPAQYMNRVWSSRLHVVSARTAPDERLSAEAVVHAPDTGLVVTVERIVDPSPLAEYPYTSRAVHDYEQWMATDFTQASLKSGLFRAIFSCVPHTATDQTESIRLYYTRKVEPLESFVQFLKLAEGWQRDANSQVDISTIQRREFSSAFLRVRPGHYDCYD